MQDGMKSVRRFRGRPGSVFAAARRDRFGARPRRLALASGALTLVCAALAWGAAGGARDSVVLWSGDDEWVRIEPQDDPAAAPNDQPVQLGAEAVEKALAALQIALVDPDTGAESRRAVFTADELRDLTPRVATGLAKAGPRQDVTFSTIDSRSLAAGGVVRKPGVNAGRVFYQDGRLNVIFGELQSPYRKRNVYGQRNEDFTPRRQGSRSDVAAQKWALAAGPGLAFHRTQDGGIRSDWVAIDTAAARPVALAAPRSGDGAASNTTPPTASAAPKAEAPVSGAASAPATGTHADLEQRLRKLKELRDKGLISEEAYKARMQELLSEL